MGNWYKPRKSKQTNNGAIDELNEREHELLFLVPLVQVAWAHGAVSPRERQVIFEAAREESIDELDSLNDRLARMLVYQPSRRFFDNCLRLINNRLRQMPVSERERRKRRLLERATRVAAAAGDKSLMDTEHRISVEERLALAEIVVAMNETAATQQTNRSSAS